MGTKDRDASLLGTSHDLAGLIVDMLVDCGFVEKSRFHEAAECVKDELDCQHAVGRVALRSDDDAADSPRPA